MIHLAIDHGKKFSHAIALTDDGDICFDGQIPTTYEGFESIKEALPAGEPVHSTIEASWNWGKVYDALEDLGLDPQLANPLKSRLVAESLTKTDRNDQEPDPQHHRPQSSAAAETHGSFRKHRACVDQRATAA